MWGDRHQLHNKFSRRSVSQIRCLLFAIMVLTTLYFRESWYAWADVTFALLRTSDTATKTRAHNLTYEKLKAELWTQLHISALNIPYLLLRVCKLVEEFAWQPYSHSLVTESSLRKSALRSEICHHTETQVGWMERGVALGSCTHCLQLRGGLLLQWVHVRPGSWSIASCWVVTYRLTALAVPTHSSKMTLKQCRRHMCPEYRDSCPSWLCYERNLQWSSYGSFFAWYDYYFKQEDACFMAIAFNFALEYAIEGPKQSGRYKKSTE
jgi:hypothetical protein